MVSFVPARAHEDVIIFIVVVDLIFATIIATNEMHQSCLDQCLQPPTLLFAWINGDPLVELPVLLCHPELGDQVLTDISSLRSGIPFLKVPIQTIIDVFQVAIAEESQCLELLRIYGHIKIIPQV